MKASTPTLAQPQPRHCLPGTWVRARACTPTCRHEQKRRGVGLEAYGRRGIDDQYLG